MLAATVWMAASSIVLTSSASGRVPIDPTDDHSVVAVDHRRDTHRRSHAISDRIRQLCSAEVDLTLIIAEIMNPITTVQ